MDQLAEVLPPGGLTLVSSCSAESDLLADAVDKAGEALGEMIFSGIFVPGLNKQVWHPNPRSRTLTFFLTPELKALGPAVQFLPLCYNDTLALLRRMRAAAVLVMLSPPDAEGRCSFGTAVDFIADLWREIPVRIAHINPSMPATPGDPGIPIDELTAFIEGDQPLRSTADGGTDAVAEAIGHHIAGLVPDGATLQTGLGKVPGAVLRALKDHRRLRVHSGLIGDAVLDLVECGALVEGRAITAGVAIGSKRLYDAVDGRMFDFRPVSVTHGFDSIRAKPPFVTINSAIEVDLFGQAFAEATPRGFASGPGGASDFARGARAGDGLRIIALPASGPHGTSRIVAPGASTGPVSLGRTEIDIVATEHGVADLRETSYAERAAKLIALADPAQREALVRQWSVTRALI
ncbi:MAG: acetyl-CoA hydrolase/transferase C-terminal domain-containing protein [Sphingomicrobium sp.]